MTGNPPTGTNYYLLEQNDYDGNSQSFPPTTCSADNTIVGYIYPNPALSQFTLRLNPEAQWQTITISDMTGRMVYSNTLSPIAIGTRQSTIVINVSNLPAGMYLVTINGEDINPVVKKLVISRR